MTQVQGSESQKYPKNMPQLSNERGLTDAKMREIRQLSDPQYEQEESDIM